jgi:hypothetical protein
MPVAGKNLCPPQDERGSADGGAKFRDTFAPSAGGPLVLRSHSPRLSSIERKPLDLLERFEYRIQDHETGA